MYVENSAKDDLLSKRVQFQGTNSDIIDLSLFSSGVNSEKKNGPLGANLFV